MRQSIIKNRVDLQKKNYLYNGIGNQRTANGTQTITIISSVCVGGGGGQDARAIGNGGRSNMEAEQECLHED